MSDAAQASRPTSDSTSVHASTAVVGEAGVLVRGASGSGKSSTVLALVAAARSEGRFARLVADDRTLLHATGGRIVARPHPLVAGLVERRGLGLLAEPHEPACVLALVVDLVSAPVPRLPEPEAHRTLLCDIDIERLAVESGGPPTQAVALIMSRLTQRRLPFFLPTSPQCTR